jgi:hypothetical protein
MGMYDTYGEVQLKVGDVEMRHFQIGDEVPIEDGVYVAREGVVVIADSRFFAYFPKLISKWGDEIDPADVIRPFDYIKDAVDTASHHAELIQRTKQGEPTRAKTIALIDLYDKRQQFDELVGYDRSPEVYFGDYADKEPEIWVSVLDDLQIPVPDGWVEFVNSQY